MIRRRAAAMVAAGLAALTPLVVASPARAESIRGGITSPDEGATLATATPKLSASFAHPDGLIESIVLEVVSERSGDRQSKSEPGNDRSSVAVEWSPQLAHNGRYELTATATGRHEPDVLGRAEEPPPPAQAKRTFFLAAPPAAPAEVTASESSGNIVVRWAANTEPDLVGYQIERAAARTNDFRAVGISTAARFTDDTITAPGRYIYRVIAVRQGAHDEGVASEPSAASRAVEVETPPTTTTVPGDPDADDGSGGTDGSSTATTTPAGGTQSSPPVRRSGTVDLSGFRTLLEENTTTPVAPGESDPGFQQTLPFDAAADEADAPGDEPQIEVGLGDPLDASADEEAERRRSLSFVAGGLLLFVLLMGTLFLRGEVNRSDQFNMDPIPLDQP